MRLLYNAARTAPEGAGSGNPIRSENGMSRIFCIVGKSGAGKDTFYKAVLERYGGALTPIVPCTTRPMREGERNGENYFFMTEAQLAELESRGQIIEKREYRTVQGLWTYFTRRFSPMEGRDYIVITTPVGARSFIRTFGTQVRPVNLTLPDGQRLRRCMDREERQARPDYVEMCRRFLADEKDFAPEKLAGLPGLRTIRTDGTVEQSLREWERIFREA